MFVMRLPKKPDLRNGKSDKPLSMAGTDKQIALLNEEFGDLRGDESDAARARRHAIRSELRKLTDYKLNIEPLSIVLVPQGATGEFFRINDRIFAPGEWKVPASVGQVLLHMISQNQIRERELLKQNGREIDLTPTNQRARMDAILSEATRDGGPATPLEG